MQQEKFWKERTSKEKSAENKGECGIATIH